MSSRVDELLELVGLPTEMRSRYPAQLSGGQRQRVGVARALAVDPPVMLMDEPFGAIDPISRERLQNEFLRLQAELRKTIVFVTHDIDEAIKMGDRIAVLQVGGKLAQYAPPGGAADRARQRVRRGLRRRRPRAQAPRAAARARHRPVDRGDVPRRRVDDRGARARRRRRSRHPAARRRRATSARLAQRARADRRARASRAALAGRADRRARRHPARRAVGSARPRVDVRAGRRCRRTRRRRAVDPGHLACDRRRARGGARGGRARRTRTSRRHPLPPPAEEP